MDVRREREHCLLRVQESLGPWETVEACQVSDPRITHPRFRGSDFRLPDSRQAYYILYTDNEGLNLDGKGRLYAPRCTRQSPWRAWSWLQRCASTRFARHVFTLSLTRAHRTNSPMPTRARHFVPLTLLQALSRHRTRLASTQVRISHTIWYSSSSATYHA